MFTSSLQSTWDSQRSKQKPRYSTAAYHAYNMQEDESNGTSAYGNNGNDRQPNRSLFSTQPYSSNNRNQLDSANAYPELPNLKIPQIGASRANGNVAHNGTVGLSPRSVNNNNTTTNGPAREILNVGRKYRGSSRQSSQSHRSNRRHKFSENYSGVGNGGQDVAGVNNHGNLPKQSAQAATNTQLLPQINGGTSAQQSVPSNASKRQHNLQNVQNYAPGAAASANGVTHEEHQFAAVTSVKGLKPGNPNWTNQDNFFVAETFDNRDIRIYCVLDGHGENGHHVSRRCRDLFPQIIKSSNLNIAQAFLAMQNDLNGWDVDVRCSGATCVMATLFGGKLSVYNCGDSRAVLGRRNPNGSISAHALSSDHKPDKPEERKRILGCGGHLGCRQVLVNQGGRGPVSMPVGPCRVWYQHRGETLGLAMSRSLGDAIVHKCGVSAEPELLEHMVDENDEFFILATDGVWDVVDNNHAVQMVHNISARLGSWNPLEAANSICKFARSRWEKLSPMIDDITCIVVKIHR